MKREKESYIIFARTLNVAMISGSTPTSGPSVAKRGRFVVYSILLVRQQH